MKRIFLILIITTNFVFSQETGVKEITNFSNLAVLRTDILSLQQSSHDPAGQNQDGYLGGNFPGTYNGENIMLQAKGKGIINRLWITGYLQTDKIKIYFDGETTASVDETVASFFVGTNAPYLSPLVVNDDVSSGGFFSYMPFPFSESIIITTTGNFYYNINYQLYENNNTDINTWTGTEDLTSAYTIFNNKGDDPRTNTNYTTESNTINLTNGATQSVININASNQTVGHLSLKIPDLEFSEIADDTFTDNGKATVGYSQFTLNIEPTATDILLTRRIDYWVQNQKANVFVDGQLVGEWFTPQLDVVYRWLDAEFNIPSSFTTGKNEITVRVEYISSNIDWNEFYYWIHCDGVLTDEIDVGTYSSESAHSYTIYPLSWQGSVTASYPPSELTGEEQLIRDKNSEILQNVNIQIYYDGEATPSVDAPIGLFFGGGTIDAVKFQSLPVGVDNTTDEMYCYFPMPFENSFELKLVNNSIYDLSNVEVVTEYESLNTDISNVGYFKTQFKQEYPTTTDQDFNFLEETGYGKYVGVVLEVFGGEDNSWLEGDERFYIDGSRTPSLYGTGTEDYFNGAWYFSRGTFHLATHGYTAVSGFDRSLYRFHLSDPVYFMKNAKLGMEHGWVNDINANYQSLAFYYHQPNEKFVLTDELNLGDSQSELDHNYSALNSLLRLDKTYYFEGDEDTVPITETGYIIKGISEFTVKITPDSPVRIKRMFDYAVSDNSADIYVDGIYVGNWYTNGKNISKRWREEFFMIPAEFTTGKSEITIKIDAPTDSYHWSEFHYWVYSKEINSLAVSEYENNDFIIYPNPSNTYIFIKNGTSDIINHIKIIDIRGRTVKQSSSVYSEHKIDISNLNEGLYFIQAYTNNGSITKKFIKN